MTAHGRKHVLSIVPESGRTVVDRSLIVLFLDEGRLSDSMLSVYKRPRPDAYLYCVIYCYSP